MLMFAMALLGHARDRGRAAYRSEEGASVLEWALIAAVVVVAAAIIGSVVYNIVQTKSDAVNQCANQPAGTAC